MSAFESLRPAGEIPVDPPRAEVRAMNRLVVLAMLLSACGSRPVSPPDPALHADGARTDSASPFSHCEGSLPRFLMKGVVAAKPVSSARVGSSTGTTVLYAALLMLDVEWEAGHSSQLGVSLESNQAGEVADGVHDLAVLSAGSRLVLRDHGAVGSADLFRSDQPGSEARGTITLESRPQEGTTVTVKLPVAGLPSETGGPNPG